jgi:hypothetical protein
MRKRGSGILQDVTDHVIAILALVFGGISAAVGTWAIIYAHLAVNRANDARRLATTANDIAARGEAREVEKHDVHWEGEWDPAQPGRYLLRKRGRAEAREVRVRITYSGDHEQTAEVDSMTDDGETLEFIFREALSDFQEEYAERDYSRMASQAGIFTAGAVMRTYGVQERVEWLTVLGTPKLHDHHRRTTFSQYFKNF